MNIKIGENIKKIRKTLHIDKKTFAKKLGIHFNTLGNYEKGETPIPVSILLEISKILKVPLNILFNEIPQKLEFPVLKKILAGEEPCSLESKQIINLNELFPTGSIYCILQVDGPKMKHTGIFKNDWVLIDTGEKEIKDGELYAIGIFDKNQKEAPATIKRLRKRGNDIIAIGGERHYDIEFYKKHQIKIVGKVVKIIKDIK